MKIKRVDSEVVHISLDCVDGLVSDSFVHVSSLKTIIEELQAVHGEVVAEPPRSARDYVNERGCGSGLEFAEPVIEVELDVSDDADIFDFDPDDVPAEDALAHCDNRERNEEFVRMTNCQECGVVVQVGERCDRCGTVTDV